MNVIKPKLLVIDARLQFCELFPKAYDYLSVELVQKPSEGLQLAHNSKIDVIILDLDTEEYNPFELSMQFKQSMITRDIPILILSNDQSLHSYINTFRFGGVDFIPKDSSPEELIAKVAHHASAFTRAKEYQYLDAPKNLSPEYLLDMQLERLQRRSDADTHLSLLLFEVDTSEVTISHADASDISNDMCGIIKRIIKRENDSVVKLSEVKYAVVLPQTNLQGAISIADRINNTFYFTTNSPTSKISFPTNALKVGITSVNSLSQSSNDKIRELAEAALAEAKRSNEFFCIN